MAGTRNGATVQVLADQPNVAREFAFSKSDFQTLARLAYEYAGIALSESKQNLIYSRLSRRLRALKLGSFRDYCDYLASEATEIENFINSLSTNHTKFFREVHHFEHLRAHVALPFAQAVARKPGGRLRVWSAGCSTGEEPYTIAVVLKRELRNLEQHDVKILATDIDTNVTAKGMAGEYPVSSIDEVPKTYREYFKPADGDADSPNVVMGDDVKSLIS